MNNIASAIEYYKDCGYRYLDVPWFVSRESMDVTAPPDKRRCSCFLGELVASGEQSFIELFRTGQIVKGKYQCMTPCFRDEDVVDDLHRNYFFKVELIDLNPDDPDKSLESVLYDAFDFFGNRSYSKIEVVATEIGYDLNCRGIELGSYGIRSYGNFTWVYGTGIAEPRFSQVENAISTPKSVSQSKSMSPPSSAFRTVRDVSR